MWSYNRRHFLLASVALAGCGFTPVYGPNGVGNSLYGLIEIESPTTTNTYNLVSYLEDRLGRGSNAQYGLTHAVTSSQQGLAVTESQTTVRYNVLGELSFALRNLSSGNVVSSGTVTAMTAYSASGTTVATRAAQKDANERLMIALADRLIERLYLIFPEANE
jgi:LPS-assembly lipoprotein